MSGNDMNLTMKPDSTIYKHIIKAQNPVIPIRTNQSDLPDFNAKGRLLSGE